MPDNRIPCFLIGLGLGAAVGFLVAPKRGRDTRAALRKTAREGGEFVRRSSNEAREVASEVIDRAKDAAEAQRVHLESALEAGVEAYRKAAGSHW